VIARVGGWRWSWSRRTSDGGEARSRDLIQYDRPPSTIGLARARLAPPATGGCDARSFPNGAAEMMTIADANPEAGA
jgi:hypothetical protein